MTVCLAGLVQQNARNRISRSSLNSEPQAASACVDSIDWIKTFLALLENPDLHPGSEEIMKQACPSALIEGRKLCSMQLRKLLLQISQIEEQA